MTRQIDKGEEIAGVPIIRVRDFFRRVLGWHWKSFDLEVLQVQLEVDESFARAFAQALVDGEYVKPLENNSYEVTDKGLELSRASASGKIMRSTAETGLEGLLKRAEEYNADTSKILTVDAVAVFGSFLGDKTELGDLDVAVKWRDRISGGDRPKRHLDYARRSGRELDFITMLSWPETELYQILKARKRTIRIQDWNSFTHLVANDPERCVYRIVFVDSERVKAEITLEAEDKRKRRLESPIPRLEP